MMKRKLFLVASLFLTLCFGAFAEDHAANSPGGGGATQATGTQRPTVANVIREKEVKLITENFPLNEKYVTKTYGTELSSAVDKAMAGTSEEEIARVTAELFGRVGRPQLDAIYKNVQKAKDEESSKDSDKRDPRFVAFLDRLAWAAELLEGKPSKLPEAQEFNKKFAGEKLDFKTGEFKKVQDKNELVLSKMKDAANGNTEAKKYLRENLNRDAFLSFVDGQRKAGNDKLAKDLVNAVSWNTNGHNFIDVIGPNNTTGRLYLGKTPEQATAALKAFSDRFGGLANFALSQTQINEPAKNWFAGPDGKLAVGIPQGVTPPAAKPAQADNRAQTADAAAAAVGAAASGNIGGALSAASISSFLGDAKGGNCLGCHKDLQFTGSSVKDFKMSKNGKTFNLAQALASIDLNATMKNGVSQAVKDQIKKWADQQ